jgi:heme/copper-type cytochrome/quinol oxidase subunit 2
MRPNVIIKKMRIIRNAQRVPMFVPVRSLLVATALTLINVAPAVADIVSLEIAGHKFTPADVTVPANQKFQIKVTNHDGTPAEFESHDMKVEKIVVPGGTITVNVGPLKPGTYQFVDEYNPDDAKGTVTAKE